MISSAKRDSSKESALRSQKTSPKESIKPPKEQGILREKPELIAFNDGRESKETLVDLQINPDVLARHLEE